MCTPVHALKSTSDHSSNTRPWLGFAQKHVWNTIEELFLKSVKKYNLRRQFLQQCFKFASEQILVGIWCLKYQKLFKTIIRSRFQGMYWRAHKTATLTSFQRTVPPSGFSNQTLCICMWFHDIIELNISWKSECGFKMDLHHCLFINSRTQLSDVHFVKKGFISKLTNRPPP